MISVLLSSIAVTLPFALAQSLASRCTAATFSDILPSNATLIYAVKYAANATFDGQVTVSDPICAVYVNVTSSTRSAFEFGLWLPTETWNERYIAFGNGGFMGGVQFSELGLGLQYGFASVSTNTGHNDSMASSVGGTGSTNSSSSSNPTASAGAGGVGGAAQGMSAPTWALNNLDSQADWGYRALHGSVALGKILTEAFYNETIKYSYYTGCSTGGRQGLKSLQMFPDDFDGVLAGAPAWWTTHLQNWNLKTATYNLPNNASHHLATEDFTLISNEIFRQCDAVDGLADDIITNPYACNFRPETLLCNSSSSSNSSGSTSTNLTNSSPSPSSSSSSCLTPAQLDTVYNYYRDWVDVNQTFIFPSFTYGSEVQFADTAITTNESNPSGIDYARYFLYSDPTWPWQNLDYSTVELAEAMDPGNATADDFDLSPFMNRGGKLLHYHGLADGSISVGSSIYFYTDVMRTMVPRVVNLTDFYRLFLIPGMQHCSGNARDAPWYIGGLQASSLGSGAGAGAMGGSGVSYYSVPGFMDKQHDALLALMAWVENGDAPDSIIATKYFGDDPAKGVEIQRPVCVYPAEPKYLGSGSPNVTSSFVCAEA